MAEFGLRPGHGVEDGRPPLESRDARHVGEEDELLRGKGRGDGGGGRVAVDVVASAPVPAPMGAMNRTKPSPPRSAAPPGALPSRLPQAPQVERLAGVPAPRGALVAEEQPSVLPQSPTAFPPKAVISATIRWLDGPPRTISTNFHRLRGGHPQPLRPPGGDDSLSSIPVDLGPPPWTITGRIPTYWSRTMSCAERRQSARRPSSRRRRTSHTVFPVNSRMYGSASIQRLGFPDIPFHLSPRPSENVPAEVGVLHDSPRAAPRHRAG